MAPVRPGARFMTILAIGSVKRRFAAMIVSLSGHK
jgi:hypothetical protein